MADPDVHSGHAGLPCAVGAAELVSPYAVRDRFRLFILIPAQGLREWHGVVVLRRYLEGPVRRARDAFVSFTPLIGLRMHLAPARIMIYLLQLYSGSAAAQLVVPDPDEANIGGCVEKVVETLF